RIAESLVVHDHEYIDEHSREHDPDREIAEGTVHAVDLADDLDRVSGRKLLLKVRDYLADLVGNAAEIAVLDARIDFVDGLNVRLVCIGWHAAACECGHVA